LAKNRFVHYCTGQRKMNASVSETLFEKYLEEHNFDYTRDYSVNSHDVDFRILAKGKEVLADVKEVKKSKADGECDAYRNIREDIKRLRKKFNEPPNVPVILVTMNFSERFFTGLTVSRALMGDIGIEFDKISCESLSDLHHLSEGNSALTSRKNTSITGIFVFDVPPSNHRIFLNPYANKQIPENFFPETEIAYLTKRECGETLINFSSLMFYPWNNNLKICENSHLTIKQQTPYSTDDFSL
jgi:hypothetical protein